MRCRSSSSIAWKMPEQPPFSTIHSAVSAAFSTVGSRPRPLVTSPRRLPASDGSQSQRASCTLFGSPPPRSSRMMRAVSFCSSERIDGVAQTLQDRLAAAFERPRRHQRRLDARRRRGVGILIDGRVDAARARLVHQLQRVDAPAPVLLADDLVVRDLRRQAALLADLDRLAHAVEDRRPLRRACGRCRCRPSAPATFASSTTSAVGVNVPGT